MPPTSSSAGCTSWVTAWMDLGWVLESWVPKTYRGSSAYFLSSEVRRLGYGQSTTQPEWPRQRSTTSSHGLRISWGHPFWPVVMDESPGTINRCAISSLHLLVVIKLSRHPNNVCQTSAILCCQCPVYAKHWFARLLKPGGQDSLFATVKGRPSSQVLDSPHHSTQHHAKERNPNHQALQAVFHWNYGQA